MWLIRAVECFKTHLVSGVLVTSSCLKCTSEPIIGTCTAWYSDFSGQPHIRVHQKTRSDHEDHLIYFPSSQCTRQTSLHMCKPESDYLHGQWLKCDLGHLSWHQMDPAADLYHCPCCRSGTWRHHFCWAPECDCCDNRRWWCHRFGRCRQMPVLWTPHSHFPADQLNGAECLENIVTVNYGCCLM